MNKQEKVLKVRTGLIDNHDQSAPKGCKPSGRAGTMARFIVPILIMLTLMFAQMGGAVDSAQAAEACTSQKGQAFLDEGRYDKAIHEFSCVIDAQPTEVDGYRGRIEAEILLGQYSNAVRDYSRVIAYVVPVHPDTEDIIVAGYDARLANSPDNIPALMGKSFAYWWFFDYHLAIPVLNHLLEVQPNSLYGNLLRGSSRMLSNTTKSKGAADLEKAIALAPQSPDVRFIVADAYTYGQPDPQRAFMEANLALAGGLDTPRIHAILATSYQAFGDELAAATEIKTHIDAVTTELLPASPLIAETSLSLDLVPGRTYEIPLAVTVGQTISIATSSPDFWDSILVLLAPDGSPAIGSDDTNAYFAAIEWTAPTTGTYYLQVTSFESVSTGELVVTRN